MGSRVVAQAALIALAVLAGAPAAWAQSACRDDAVTLRGPFGEVRFGVSVADTPEERAQGLMHVDSLPRFEGMLFVYQSARPVSFWMKNTLIPLDILYADARGEVISIAAEAVPGDLTPLPSGGPAQFVLEINGGLAEQLGIEPGAQMRHPRIENAAWPCE